MREFERDNAEGIIGKEEAVSYLSQWLVCTGALIIHIGFLIFFHIYEVMELFYVNIGSVSLYIFLLVYLLLCRPQHRDAATIAAGIEILLHQTLCMVFLGLPFGYQQFLVPMAAYMFLYTAKSRRVYIINSVIAAVSICVYAVSGIVFRNMEAKYTLPEKLTDVMYGVITIVAFAVLLMFVWTMSFQRNRNYRETIEKNRELAHLARVRSDFLAKMSHELRTPLNVMVGMTEMTLEGELPEGARRNLEYVQGTGKSLLETVSGLLDVSRVETGMENVMERAYEPRRVAEEVAAMMGLAAEEKKLMMRLEVPDELPEVLIGDENRLRQVLYNLLANAVKFTKEGGITLRLSCSIEEDVCHVTYAVSDTGVGIKQEDKERIFDLYGQEASNRNRADDGVGLGLAISRKLTGLLGGSLEVDSTYNEGSCFYFTLSQKIAERT